MEEKKEERKTERQRNLKLEGLREERLEREEQQWRNDTQCEHTQASHREAEWCAQLILTKINLLRERGREGDRERKLILLLWGLLRPRPHPLPVQQGLLWSRGKSCGCSRKTLQLKPGVCERVSLWTSFLNGWPLWLEYSVSIHVKPFVARAPQFLILVTPSLWAASWYLLGSGKHGGFVTSKYY